LARADDDRCAAEAGKAGARDRFGRGIALALDWGIESKMRKVGLVR
jgi:hypothetical protein